MVGVSASVILLLHHKVQKFSSGTGCKTVVVVWQVLQTATDRSEKY